MRKNKKKIGAPRTLRVPEEVDQFILAYLKTDPELTYASVLRKLLRAGRADIERGMAVKAGQTQIDMAAMEALR